MHRSKNEGKKKILRKKRGEKKSLLSGRSVFASIWRVFCVDLLGWPHVPLCIPSAGSHPSDVILLIVLPTCSCGSTRATRMINHPNRMGLARKHNEQVTHSLSFFSTWEDKEAPETCKNKVQLIYYTPARGTRAVTNSLLLRGLCTVSREWAEYSDLGQTLDKTKPLYLPEDSQSMTRLAD